MSIRKNSPAMRRPCRARFDADPERISYLRPVARSITSTPCRKRHGYPPDKQEQATQTVMEQAERLSETWAEDGLLEATVPPLPVTRYAAETPAELPLAAESEPAYSPSRPSQGTKPRKPRK